MLLETDNIIENTFSLSMQYYYGHIDIFCDMHWRQAIVRFYFVKRFHDNNC